MRCLVCKSGQTCEEPPLSRFFINSGGGRSRTSKPATRLISLSCHQIQNVYTYYRNTFIEPWFIFKKSRREKAIARTATEMRIMKWDTRNILRTSSWIPIILIIISAKKYIFNSLLIVWPFWSHYGTCLRPSVQSQCLQSSTPDQPSLVTGHLTRGLHYTIAIATTAFFHDHAPPSSS